MSPALHQMNATLAIAFLRDRCDLSAATLKTLSEAVLQQKIGLSVLAKLGDGGLKELGCTQLVERARIIAACAHNRFAKAPRGAHGGPVVVRPKVGFSQLNGINTVAQTVDVRFFLDLYWIDPSLVNHDGDVPEGVWRPENLYIVNQNGALKSETHGDRPVLMDRNTGLLMWAIQFSGKLNNPMMLRKFPFDADCIEVHIHQAEESNRDEYLLRSFDEPCALCGLELTAARTWSRRALVEPPPCA